MKAETTNALRWLQLQLAIPEPKEHCNQQASRVTWHGCCTSQETKTMTLCHGSWEIS